jgi:ferredoxin
MPHVVTEACVMHKYQDCVAVCPVEAFREADNYLVIDPDECIDCAACVTECPVEAIFADTDVPEDQESWIERNEAESPDLPTAEGDSPVLASD